MKDAIRDEADSKGKKQGKLKYNLQSSNCLRWAIGKFKLAGIILPNPKSRQWGPFGIFGEGPIVAEYGEQVAETYPNAERSPEARAHIQREEERERRLREAYPASCIAETREKAQSEERLAPS